MYSVELVDITVNGESKANGSTLSNLQPGSYEIHAYGNVYVGGMMLADPVEATRTFTVTAPARDAGYVSSSIPTTMVVGQSYAVSLAMRSGSLGVVGTKRGKSRAARR